MTQKIVPSETLLASVLEMACDAIIAVDESHRIILFNRGAEKSFGYARDEVTGKTLDLLLPSYDAEINCKKQPGSLNSTQTVLPTNEWGELYGRRKDGTIFPCEASVSETLFGDQTIITTVLRDLTGRKHAEELHREKNEYLENLLHYASAPTVVWNVQYQITLFNKAFEILTGRSEKYVIGKPLEILFPPDARAGSMELIRKTLENERMEAVEIKILHIDGSVKTFLWNSSTIMSPDRKTAIASMAQGLNITRRKQGEDKIARLNEILERNLTERMEQIEVNEKLAAELIRANKELAFQNEEKEKRAAELIVANKELAFQNEEKEKRAAELIVTNKELVFQIAEKGNMAAELIAAKQNAEESDTLKTAFLRNMSHEIRTPLNGVIGFSELLTHEGLSKDEINEYAALISQSGKRLIEIVNNVLDISRIQTGQVKIEQKPLTIHSIFSDLSAIFSPVAKARNISLNFHHQDDEKRAVLSDKTKLVQIFTNLLNNSVKFTKTGNIDCGYEIKDNLIQYYVRDTGIGIQKEMHTRIFDRFIQADQSLTKDYEGAGLGLSISRGLVELLDGKIWVESEIGKGSTFFFTLPYTPVEVTSQTDILNPETPGNHPHRIILIAEDDWISYEYLRRILAKSDISVIHAENGEQAVEMVRNTANIDLILMDIRMPVMNGIEATKLIKKIRPNLPIIAQTAYAFNEEKKKILSVGCDEYLAKPLEHAKLNELINMYLN